MKLLIIKDNQHNSKDDFYEVKSIVERVADKTFLQLEKEGIFIFPELVKDSNDLTKDQMILKSRNENYVSTNVMGVIGYGDEQLVIESRFSEGENDFFSQYLLEKVLDFTNFVNLNTSINQDIRTLNYLLFLFTHYLKNASRKGAFKTYIKNEYNDMHVRGSIDIARHIKKNTPFIGNISYNQREYSFDNYMMELIRHTIEFIKSKPYGYKILNTVKNEIKLIIDLTPKYRAIDRQSIIEINKNKPIHHAYYHEYKDLQKICLMILQNQKHQFGIGNHKMYGILFDGSWLWEEYLNLLLEHLFYHPMNKSKVGEQKLFSHNIGAIYPDFIGKEKDNKIIADAKYKPMDKIGNKDYLQLLAYMFRFDSKKGYYMYPDSKGTNDLQLVLNSGTTYENNVSERNDIIVIKHGLKIPTHCITYNEFVSKIHDSEKDFLASL